MQKCIGNPKTGTRSTFLVIDRHAQSGEKLESPQLVFPAEVEHVSTLPSRSGSHAANKCPCHSLFSAMLFTFLCFSLVILLFTMAPAIALPSAPQRRKTMMCFTEKITWVRKKAFSGPELLLAASPMLMNQQYVLSKESLSKSTHKIKSCIDHLKNRLSREAHGNLILSFSLIQNLW